MTVFFQQFGFTNAIAHFVYMRRTIRAKDLIKIAYLDFKIRHHALLRGVSEAACQRLATHDQR